MSKGAAHIGTSGWHYEHWRGPFYPPDMLPGRFLSHYAEHFQTTEINNTFYHLPTEKAIAGWHDSVPDDFIFAVKASRYITHMKKLKDPQKGLTPFLKRIQLLKEKLGPVLFQLPPNWRFNADRLDEFLQALPEGFRFAFEFRDESWINNLTVEALARHNAAFCIADFAGLTAPRIVTADFVYVRLHGPEAAYAGRYNEATLSGWAKDIITWLEQGKDVFCYFDNDEAAYAVKDALKLREIVQGLSPK